jgi:hypothetical protein
VDAILGRPIEGAIVSVVLQGHSAAQAETDSRGRYLIERDLRTGRKDEIIRVFARGYFPEDHRTQLGCSEIVAVSGERAICGSEVNSYLQPADRRINSLEARCLVSGRVIGANGTPLAGTQIIMEDGVTGAISDSTGTFSIGQIRSGLYILTAQTIGYFEHKKTVLVTCDGPAAPVVFPLRNQVVW